MAFIIADTDCPAGKLRDLRTPLNPIMEEISGAFSASHVWIFCYKLIVVNLYIFL